MERVFIKGNDALALAALESGLNFFTGYPITPASEIPEYLAEAYQSDLVRRERGEEPVYPGFTFLQTESEIASINMLLGAAATGARVMTASSGPGISLKMEGVSYINGSELPAVVVDVTRGGPGLGNIAPEQSDYTQVVKGGGHGSYRNIVLAPGSVQEMYDFVPLAFELAFRYRMVTFILVDSCLGQMKESIELRDIQPTDRADAGDWAVDEDPDRKRRLITSLYIEPEALEQHVLRLKAKYERVEAVEVRAEEYLTDDAEVICAAYGISARIARGAVQVLRREGIRAGLVRPKTVWPFPYRALRDAAAGTGGCLVVEMSIGQLLEDVRLAVGDTCGVELHHRLGGVLPTVTEVAARLREMVGDRDPGPGFGRQGPITATADVRSLAGGD